MNPGPESPAPSQEASTAEVEKLLATMGSPGPGGPSSASKLVSGTEPGAAQPYDFRNPMLLGPRELRKLRFQQEEFANALAARLSLYLRLEVSLKIASLQTIAFQKVAESWANPSNLTLFKMEPLRGISILEIPPRLALCFVDRLMGGPGQAPDPAPEITEIERALLEQVIQLVLTEWCGQWSSVKELKPVVLGHESNGRFVQTAPPETIMLVVSVETRIGEFAEKLQIGFPYVPLESLIRQLSQGADLTSDSGAPAGRTSPAWKSGFEEISVPLTAEWQGLELSVREVLALKPGDVVRLDSQSAQQIVVRVGELPRFQGRPGTIAGKWAVEVTRILNDQSPT